MTVSVKQKANSKEKKPKANDKLLLLIKMQKNAVFPQTDGKLSVNPPLLVNFSLLLHFL